MRITYSEPADVLTVEDETFEGYDRTVELEGMTADLSKNDTCLGLQIREATDRLGLTAADLQDVDTVDVEVATDDGLQITATVRLDGETYTATAGSSEGLRKEDTRH